LNRSLFLIERTEFIGDATNGNGIGNLISLRDSILDRIDGTKAISWKSNLGDSKLLIKFIILQ
jgi:hypothetical protein